MNDDIADIDQDPVAMGQALHPGGAQTVALDGPTQLIGDRADMTVRTARGNDHIVPQRRFSRNVDGFDVFGLGIGQAGKNNFQPFAPLLGIATRGRNNCIGGDTPAQ